MATQTTNFNLTKPEVNDYVDASVLANNLDLIDTAIFEAGNNPELEGNVAGLVEKIGNTTDVGGSDTTGSAMAKLNALLKTIGSSDTALTDLIVSLSNKGMVKSRQFGEIESGSSNTLTVTISRVDPAKCICIVNGGSTNTSNSSSFYLSAMTATSITISGSYTRIKGSWQVIEFY